MTAYRSNDAGRCVDCGQYRHEHKASEECDRTLIGVYGPENPTVKWLQEHAPHALNQPARTVAPGGLWDEDDPQD